MDENWGFIKINMLQDVCTPGYEESTAEVVSEWVILLVSPGLFSTVADLCIEKGNA